MFNCAGIVIVLVIVVGLEFCYVIVTMAVNVVVNYVSQNFQCADALVANESGSAYLLGFMYCY